MHGLFAVGSFLLLVPGFLMGATPVSLVAGDPLGCFAKLEGAGTMSVVSVAGQSFPSALHITTGTVPASANPWDIRPRCYNTAAAQQNDVVVATFWMRAVQAAKGSVFTSFVVEQGPSPYTKSVTFTVAAQAAWKKVEVPFTMAQSYVAGGYNLSFWVTYPNQELEIGGFSILDYGPNIPFSSLGLTTWPYDGHDPNAAWRAEADRNIERYRKGDIVVAVRDDQGAPLAGAPVHLKMKRHAFGFGTAVAGDVLMNANTDGQNYRAALLQLFNKAVPENALKWPFFETWARGQADYMMPWLAGNGFAQVRGHNVIWPGLSNLPADVQAMLKATPVNQAALRQRISDHITQAMAYAKGKVTEWDVLNEPYTNKDVQAALGDAEMAVWFRQARAADPNVKLYVNDYSILEAGGYDLQHINAYYGIIQKILANGGPIDGIGLQSHFDSNLTAPTRVLELLDQFGALGKDLQVTEFDVNLSDEQIQADYTRDFLTVCFSHPAVKGFMIWGFWEGAHWLPRAAMIRKDWSVKANYAIWKDLIYRQWWTDVAGVTGTDGTFHTRGFLGDYDVEVTRGGVTTVSPLTVKSNAEPAFVVAGPLVAGSIAAGGIVNAATYQGGSVAPGEVVAIFGSGFGPANIAVAAYGSDGQLPGVVGDTRVLFDGVAAPMVYAASGQVSAIVPYGATGSTKVQVEYLGVASAAVTMPVVASVPGIFQCAGQGIGPVVVNQTAGGKISCNADFVAPRAGDVVTFFVTGEGAVKPAAGDGKLPVAPNFPAPAAPVKVLFGGMEATPCAASFVGLVYAGVTQVNACVPAGVSGALALQFQVGSAVSPVAWKTIWSDEFNGAAGASVDASKWGFDLGGGGWGNQELETYTNSASNVFQDGGGNLVIRAVKSAQGTYTSARVKTQDKFSVTYGKVEARVKIPFGQGIWPAFWMLGADIGSVGWPACGEIDIMENIGREPGIVHGTVHGPGYSGANGIGSALTMPGGGRFADDYHVYGVEWSPQAIAFFVDGTQYFAVTPGSLPAKATWVYQHPFFLLLNVAVGGGWPGNPDASSTFPQEMLVDWVRVSQRL